MLSEDSSGWETYGNEGQRSTGHSRMRESKTETGNWQKISRREGKLEARESVLGVRNVSALIVDSNATRPAIFIKPPSTLTQRRNEAAEIPLSTKKPPSSAEQSQERDWPY